MEGLFTPLTLLAAALTVKMRRVGLGNGEGERVIDLRLIEDEGAKDCIFFFIKCGW